MKIFYLSSTLVFVAVVASVTASVPAIVESKEGELEPPRGRLTRTNINCTSTTTTAKNTTPTTTTTTTPTTTTTTTTTTPTTTTTTTPTTTTTTTPTTTTTTTPTTTTTTIPTTTTTTTPTTTTSTTKKTTTTTTTKPPFTAECTKPGYYVDPDSSSSYYECKYVSNVGYTLRKRECPAGQKFYLEPYPRCQN